MKNFIFTAQEYEEIMNNFQFDFKKQEKMIFEMECKGYKNKEIAQKLNITTMTLWRREKKLIERIKFYLNEKGNLKEVYCVYIHIFPNKKVYIGMTSDSLKRWDNGFGYRNNSVMFNDILKYGWNNIEHNIISENLSYYEALKIEKNKIQEYKSYDEKYGYNIKK